MMRPAVPTERSGILMMGNRVLIIIVLLLGGSVALAATNPTTRDYDLFLEGLLNEALERTDQSGRKDERDLIKSLFKSQGKLIIDSVVHPNTRRRNYGLFSLFETRVFDVRVSVLGAGGVFVPLDGVDEATRKVGQILLTPSR